MEGASKDPPPPNYWEPPKGPIWIGLKHFVLRGPRVSICLVDIKIISSFKVVLVRFYSLAQFFPSSCIFSLHLFNFSSNFSWLVKVNSYISKENITYFNNCLLNHSSTPSLFVFKVPNFYFRKDRSFLTSSLVTITLRQESVCGRKFCGLADPQNSYDFEFCSW